MEDQRRTAPVAPSSSAAWCSAAMPELYFYYGCALVPPRRLVPTLRVGMHTGTLRVLILRRHGRNNNQTPMPLKFQRTTHRAAVEDGATGLRGFSPCRRSQMHRPRVRNEPSYESALQIGKSYHRIRRRGKSHPLRTIFQFGTLRRICKAPGAPCSAWDTGGRAFLF